MAKRTRAGVIQVDFDILHQFLNLPEDARIVRVIPADAMYSERHVSLLVEGPTLPLVPPGACLTIVDPADIGWPFPVQGAITPSCP